MEEELSRKEVAEELRLAVRDMQDARTAEGKVFWRDEVNRLKKILDEMDKKGA